MKNFETTQIEKEETINLREILEKYLRYWKLFAVFSAISIVLAFVYLRYTMPIYSSKASVLIEDDEKGGALSELSVFSEMGIMGGSNNLDNEIEIMKSRQLLEVVAKKLNLNKQFIILGTKTGFQRKELFDASPIGFSAVKNDSVLYKSKLHFNITIASSEYLEISLENGKRYGNVKFGMPISTSAGQLVFYKTSKFNSGSVKRDFIVNLLPLDAVVTSLQNSIGVEAISKEGDGLSITLEGNVIEKNNAIINELIFQHDAIAVDDQNEVARKTSEFINDRMKFITVELSEVEQEGESFKTRNRLTDVTADATMFLSKESAAEQAIIDATIQLNLANYMNNYLRENKDNTELLPANLGFEDVAVVEMTNQFNKLVLDRNRLLRNSGERNPAVQKAEAQLVSMKQSISESLKNIKSSLQLSLKTLQAQESLYRSKISSVPQYEREYRSILRQQQIKETLYIFLLEKREENEIALAAAVGNAKVIDYAYSNGEPVSPKKKIIYLGALLVGLLIPIGIVYIRGILDTKVHGIKDLDKFQLQGIGEIPFNEGNDQIVSTKDSNNRISEAFRLLRTNINFMLEENKKSHVILVTSTIAGEGKTFTSINLAHALSHSGKKTVLVGLDLRAPKLKDYLGIEGDKGVSNYIVNPELTLKDILVPVEENPYLKYIFSGDIPPNPAELLMRNRFNNLILELREQFEYIILDTAPVGLVSDTLTLSNNCDLMLYVVRAYKLDKRLLSFPKNLISHKKVANLAVLINGVKNNDIGYGYGYGYGYGASNSAYYGEEKSPKIPFWRKGLMRLRNKK
jgi:capsular exopolysaccharide synthesis family protein